MKRDRKRWAGKEGDGREGKGVTLTALCGKYHPDSGATDINMSMSVAYSERAKGGGAREFGEQKSSEAESSC